MPAADTTLAPCPTEREQFEAWAIEDAWVMSIDDCFDRDRWHSDHYASHHVQSLWKAWQAARAHGIPGAPNA